MMRRLFAALLLMCVAALAQAQSVTVISAEFGVFESGRPGELVFEPTLVVPHVAGQRYGWVIELRTTQRSVAVREEYLIASADTFKEEAGGKRLTIPHERRNQVSQRQLVPVAGRIYGEWAIGPQEPPGKRRLQVLVEDRPPVVFEYEVR
ncbi:MAG: hypothetical protein AB1544_04975 [Pseudomonadota bacterium]|jgi:hypothetical protein